MTTQRAPAGWYPDPSGKPGQMYWDGRQWHHGVPATRDLARQQAQSTSAPDAPTQVVHRRPAQPSQLPPANWYPDPSGSGRLRYFTGTEWTDHYSGPSLPQQQVGSVIPGAGYEAGSPRSQQAALGGQMVQPNPVHTNMFRIRLVKHTGLVVWMYWQRYIFIGTFQQCEQAYRAAQTHNLTAGWWGVLSGLLFNWIAIFSNMSAMHELRRIAQQPSGQSPPSS